MTNPKTVVRYNTSNNQRKMKPHYPYQRIPTSNKIWNIEHQIWSLSKTLKNLVHKGRNTRQVHSNTYKSRKPHQYKRFTKNHSKGMKANSNAPRQHNSIPYTYPVAFPVSKDKVPFYLRHLGYASKHARYVWLPKMMANQEGPKKVWVPKTS